MQKEQSLGPLYEEEGRKQNGEVEWRINNPSSFIIHPEEYFDQEIFSVQLSPGIYEISCKQDITLLSTDRNRFDYSHNGITVYEDNDNLFAGRHCQTITIKEKGTFVFEYGKVPMMILLWIYRQFI